MVAVAVGLLAAACSGSSTHNATSGAHGLLKAAGIPGDFYTAPARPLDLSVALAGGGVTETIGQAGGRLSIKGPDGSTFVLTIPKMALPTGTPITMVPYARVSGLPDSTPSVHHVGVALYPEGLQLAYPGTLTITPKSPLPPAGIASLTFAAKGTDVALVLHRRAGVAEEIGAGSALFKLTIGIGSDTGGSTYLDPNVKTQYFWETVYPMADDPSSITSADPRDARAWRMKVEKDWQWDLQPFCAHVELTGRQDGGYGRVEILLEHTPES